MDRHAFLLIVLLITAPVVVSTGRDEPAAFDGVKWHVLNERQKAPLPPPPVGTAHLRNDTSIFVNIAAYRDGSRCGRTLFSLFSNALFSDRVRVGVVQQNAPGDPDCQEALCREVESWVATGAHGGGGVSTAATERLRLSVSASKGGVQGLCDSWSAQIIMKRISQSEARGPVVARAMGQKLRPRDADTGFCLQTDSHMLVSPGWDVALVRMWAAAANERGVLTTYVPKLADLGVNVNGRHEVPVVCELGFREGLPRNQPAHNAIHLSRPKLSPLWAAGFSFSKCHADAAAPYDPHLPHVFDGEEFSRGARLWTHGYDFYAPPRTVVVHDYSTTLGWRAQLGWPRDPVEEARSRRRLWSLLDMPGGVGGGGTGRLGGAEKEEDDDDDEEEEEGDLGVFGLGRERPLSAYERFVGVDLKEARNVPAPRGSGSSGQPRGQGESGRCGDLAWVPPDPQAAAAEAQARRQARRRRQAQAAGAGSGGGRWADRDRKRSGGSGTSSSSTVAAVACGPGATGAPVPDTSGVGGFTAACWGPLSREAVGSYEACCAARARSGCGALTWKHGRCFLHDTAATTTAGGGPFRTEPSQGGLVAAAAGPCPGAAGGRAGGTAGRDGGASPPPGPGAAAQAAAVQKGFASGLSQAQAQGGSSSNSGSSGGSNSSGARRGGGRAGGVGSPSDGSGFQVVPGWVAGALAAISSLLVAACLPALMSPSRRPPVPAAPSPFRGHGPFGPYGDARGVDGGTDSPHPDGAGWCL